ncbi:hypothetical protein [Rehaibacterium terrae]|jgi:hypothetical protein|uniref:Uncharacterized protein n=1 Tax=Rehaibacterium terrae TaxID=1341696 RepID=A0A7W7Y1R6_9GAMM|nr:hypothetical protein [Rehaibacterium terrae]MBB5016521.1 hypothetical protein [Rehaibacterium terrae]
MPLAHRIPFAVVLLASVSAFAQEGRQQVPIDKAAQYEGREVTVCGPVDTARRAPNVQGEPTLLHMGGAFPHHKFSARVWGQDRDKFEHDLESLVGRTACVSGRVTLVGKRPEVVLSSPEDLAVF